MESSQLLPRYHTTTNYSEMSVKCRSQSQCQRHGPSLASVSFRQSMGFRSLSTHKYDEEPQYDETYQQVICNGGDPNAKQPHMLNLTFTHDVAPFGGSF